MLLPHGNPRTLPLGRIRSLVLGIGFVVLSSTIAGASEQVGLRVGTSGDYAPFSMGLGEPGSETGFDIDVARAFTRDRGIELRFVRFRWPELLADLEANHFDVAMSGITVRPERSIAGRFSLPVATSGAVVLVDEGLPAQTASELDDEHYRIAVNAGGHLERVARGRFAQAKLRALPDNDAVIRALIDGEVDAVVTDTMEAPSWLARRPGLRVIGPLTRDRKAFLVRADERALARALDVWLLEREADGTLARIRARHLPGAQGPRTAAALRGLLASIDERLALMPLVAEAKRASGSPVEVPDREQAVIDAALDSVRAAEASMRDAGIEAMRLDDASVRSLFRALIEAAKDIQRRTLMTPATTPGARAPDLADAIRPALIRIGDRIAHLLPRLRVDLAPEEMLGAVREELAARSLDDARLREISEAIVGLRPAPPRRD